LLSANPFKIIISALGDVIRLISALQQLDMKETYIIRTTIDKAKQSEDLTDLERLSSMSESEIEANILSDLDNQPLSPDSLKKVRLKKA
jgi:hypothetical protein